MAWGLPLASPGTCPYPGRKDMMPGVSGKRWGLSTWWRTGSVDPASFRDRLTEVGAAGVALDGTVDAAWVMAWMAEAKGMPTMAVDAGCPRPRTPRAPRLATPDKDERRSAILGMRSSIRIASELHA